MAVSYFVNYKRNKILMSLSKYGIGTLTTSIRSPDFELQSSSLQIGQRAWLPYRAFAYASTGEDADRYRDISPKLYERPQRQAADYRKPRLLGGDPLLRVRLAEKEELGISDERGREQDNTWKKMRKEKPPRGHPDRKPRHKNNPRRVPDLFRVPRWTDLIRLVDHHHDYLDWKKVMSFLGRAVAFYKVIPEKEKIALRTSGLLEKIRDRAEELDIRQAERTFIFRLDSSFRILKWDPGTATRERINARKAVLSEQMQEPERIAKETMRRRANRQRDELLRLRPRAMY